MWTQISLLYPLIVTLASFLLAAFVSAHVILYKRDVRAAIGWVGIIWLTPFIGSVLYLALGINRVRRKARKVYGGVPASDVPSHVLADRSTLDQTLGQEHRHLKSLVEYVDKITD